FANNNRRRVAFLVGQFLQKNNLCTVVFNGEIFLLQISHQWCQFVVVKTFTAHIVIGQSDVELLVNFAAVVQRHFLELLPERQNSLVTGLQAYYIVACLIGKGCVVIKVFFGLLV